MSFIVFRLVCYVISFRTHQLRVHMSSIGHPILGDLFYASKELYHKVPRLMLHAEEIRLRHPRLRYDIQFIAPCPFDLQHVS
jgi:tRNA pseudouridine32 synthase/23S rRNA pseudouridine746 synthase